MAVGLVKAGFSLDELGDLPLDSWVAFYRSAQAQELDRLAAQVSVIHSANAKRMRAQLLKTAREVRFPKKPIVGDVRKLKAMLTGVPGVVIKEGSKQE